MALNKKFERGVKLQVVCTHPAAPISGDPVRYGTICGVAQADEDADGLTSVDFEGVYNLSVAAINAGGNVAVNPGDKIYYTDADTPRLNAKIAGTPFGIAMAAITSGATATIPVMLLPGMNA